MTINDNEPELPETPVQEPDLTQTSSQTFSTLGVSDELVVKLQEMGCYTPNDVQTLTLPVAFDGSDVMVQARTGSGKTLSFVLPLLRALEKQGSGLSSTFGLIVTPTRELALQIKSVINRLTDTVKPVALIGGVDIDQQMRELREDPRVVIGTPGRVLDLVRHKSLKLKSCRYFVLDEADETLSMGFLEDVRAILSTLPDRRQGLFVSATITPRVEMLASSFLSKPKRISLGDYTVDMPSVTHYFCEVGGELMAKPSALCDLIETFRPRSAIIFCNTKSDTQLVEALLRRRGFDARRINSDLSQNQRNKIMNKIRAEELQLLVATDIAARGLDIEQIDLVVNYNIHEQPEVYLHRTGRTGRAGRAGKAINLIGPRDVGSFHYLRKVLDVQFEKFPLPTDEELVQARVSHLYGMLREKEIDLSERDLLVGKKMSQELGGLQDPPEELATTIAKLCRYTMEHFINLEARSLDEELEGRQEEERAQGERERHDHDKRSGRGGRDREQRGRGERGRPERGEREQRHGREREENRPRRDDRERGERGDRRDERDHRRGREEGRNRQEYSERDRGRGRDRNQDRARDQDRGRRRYNEPAEEHRDEDVDEIRLYIGQGLEQGMTIDLFKDLAMEFAELRPEDLNKLTIRKNYGFVDLQKPQADILVQSLNGIEYNGAMLPVEYASTLTRKPERGGMRKRGPERR